MSKLKNYINSLNSEELAKLLHNRITLKQTGRGNLLTWDELKISTKDEHKLYMENIQSAINELVIGPFKLAVELYQNDSNEVLDKDGDVFFRGKKLVPCYFCGYLATELTIKDPPTCYQCAPKKDE